MYYRLALASLAALALAATLACGGVTNPSQNTVENFTGTIQPLGSGPVHNFNVSNTGELTITVTSFSPSVTVFLGMALGTASSSGCAELSENDNVTVGQAAFASTINPGAYCVVLFDFTGLSTATTYNLRVSHP